MTTQSPAWVSSADDMAAVVAGEGSLQPKSIEPPSARRARPSDLKSTLRCGIPWQIAKPPPSSSDADTEGSRTTLGTPIEKREQLFLQWRARGREGGVSGTWQPTPNGEG
jgi:hypothetical protein